MAKSRYDRNVDKGAAQQRHGPGQGHGQGMKKEDNKPGKAAEEPVRFPRHGGAPKNPGGPARGDHQHPPRPKSRDDNG